MSDLEVKKKESTSRDWTWKKATTLKIKSIQICLKKERLAESPFFDFLGEKNGTFFVKICKSEFLRR